MSVRRRSAPALILGLLVSVLLAGCVTLPDSSPVNPGRGAGVHEPRGLIHYSPRGPQTDATKSTIVNQYLQAMLAFPQSPDLVRQFLTPAAAQVWRPGEQLLVYENTTVTAGPNGSIALHAPVLGSLNERGSWVSATAADNALDINVSLVRVNGQWRIVNPPPGTLLDTDTFDRYYHQYSLYYFDPTHSLLTPDPVFELLGSPNHMATALVRNLILGPTESMAGVVSSEVPSTTQVLPGVTVSEKGVAQIPLTKQVLLLSPTELQLFAAQLAWTLRQDRVGVSRFRLTVEGRPIPGFSEAFSVDSFEIYDPTIFNANRSLYALSDGVLVTLSTSGVVVPILGPIGSLGTRARSAAISISNDPSLGALVPADGTSVVVGGTVSGDGEVTKDVWLDGADDLLRPSWDWRKLLWVVDRTPHGAVVKVLTANQQVIVQAPGISGENVRAFAVSRDGMRFAAIIGQGSAARLVIAMIRRSATSRTDVALTGLQTIVNADYPLANITRLAWFSPTVVAVLAQDVGSETQPYEVAIDGSKIQPTSGFLPVRPFSLAAAADTDVPSVVGTSDGRLYIRTPNQQWESLTPRRLFAPVYPG